MSQTCWLRCLLPQQRTCFPLCIVLHHLVGTCLGQALKGICWGDAAAGGICEGLDFTNITHVQSNWHAFVAWDNRTGRVVCWGEEETQCNHPVLNLTGTARVYSTMAAFVALSEDAGTAHCWGDKTEGGNCSGLNFSGVTEVHSTRYAFLAVNRRDGRALCWGRSDRGGSCDGLNLLGFDEVHSSWGLFLALNKVSGEVRCWGSHDEYYGGPGQECRRAAEAVAGFRLVSSAPHAFAALGQNVGNGTCWGDPDLGGTCSASGFIGASEIHSNRYAFVAVDKSTGAARCWGDDASGGNCEGRSLAGFDQIFSSWGVFLATNLSAGKATCWGSSRDYLGGPPTACQSLDFANITDVVASPHAFVAADRNTGRTLCWGKSTWGGDCPDLVGRRIAGIHATRSAFLALVPDDSATQPRPEVPQGSRQFGWLWISASVVASVLLLSMAGHLWCRRKASWNTNMPLHPWVLRKVSKLRSRSSSFGKSPKLQAVFGRRAEKLLARAALQAAGGPPYWGLTVQQLQHFYDVHRPVIEEYCRAHRVDENSCHVCLQDPCPHFHGDADYRCLNCQAEEEEESLSPLPFNMHLVVQLIIKPQTRNHLGILGFWATCNQLSPLKVQAFISHCWNHDFGRFIRAISTLGPDTVVWVCSFALPQNIDINQVVGTRIMHSPFAEALSSADKVCLVVDEQVEVLTRSWCCFELYLSVSRRIALDIRAPITSPAFYSRVLDRAAHMDVRECRSSKEADHMRILRVLRGTEDAVNRKVRQQVEQIVRLLAAAYSQAQYDLESPAVGGVCSGSPPSVSVAARESQSSLGNL
mmetsp:Transcript_42311/g.122335  ORF Transcript_42311/g.122335 Transcript_42311/m.122335 type:complete len:812 (+) Transcript_42311:79-2514(+)